MSTVLILVNFFFTRTPCLQVRVKSSSGQARQGGARQGTSHCAAGLMPLPPHGHRTRTLGLLHPPCEHSCPGPATPPAIYSEATCSESLTEFPPPRPPSLPHFLAAPPRAAPQGDRLRPKPPPTGLERLHAPVVAAGAAMSIQRCVARCGIIDLFSTTVPVDAAKVSPRRG